MIGFLKRTALTIYHIFVPHYRDIWPDIDCAKEPTHKVSKGGKLRSKGKPVTPIENYIFHSDFDTLTDGDIWIIKTDSRFIDYIVGVQLIGAMLLILLPVFWFYKVPFELTNVFILPMLFGLVFFSLLARWEKGDNKWIVFDRSSGNVCFWHKSKRKSLTVPFEIVNCYWHRKAYRGGVSRNFMLMPEVSLRGEWNRWWNTYFGSTEIYSQAQYLWRVLSDFMDNSKPIPELPGLTHQIRSCQKLGYTIEDLTHGGKEIPIEVWMAVDKEIQEEIEAVANKADQLLEPENFSANVILEYSKTIPPLARRELLIHVKMAVGYWSRWTRDHGGLFPGMSKRYTPQELGAEIDQLIELVRGGLSSAGEEWEADIRNGYDRRK
ncbi:hypothetical protein [Saccharospirillum impatiens]|uniref:hypothetical protein n=1 Tax=Saccharospirillum impatiens TaxID=169438 RepID=UPI0003F8E515|nr:hypothetical protein [Saccharospirillum impatiens]